jgi:hypothetical protein
MMMVEFVVVHDATAIERQGLYIARMQVPTMMH